MLADPQQSALQAQLGWWLGTVRRRVQQLQVYDQDLVEQRRAAIAARASLQRNPDEFQSAALPVASYDWMSRFFDEGQALVNALAQVKRHLDYLSANWTGDRKLAGQAYLDEYKRTRVADLRNAIEHMADHVAGDPKPGTERISPDDFSNVGPVLELGWPDEFRMFGLTYHIGSVVDTAALVDAACGGSRDLWPSRRDPSLYLV